MLNGLKAYWYEALRHTLEAHRTHIFAAYNCTNKTGGGVRVRGPPALCVVCLGLAIALRCISSAALLLVCLGLGSGFYL
jgi:hypothetical protein